MELSKIVNVLFEHLIVRLVGCNQPTNWTIGWLGFYGISTIVGYGWLVSWLVGFMAYNPCRLFNAKSIFIQIISSISKNSVHHEYRD